MLQYNPKMRGDEGMQSPTQPPRFAALSGQTAPHDCDNNGHERCQLRAAEPCMRMHARKQVLHGPEACLLGWRKARLSAPFTRMREQCNCPAQLQQLDSCSSSISSIVRPDLGRPCEFRVWSQGHGYILGSSQRTTSLLRKAAVGLDDYAKCSASINDTLWQEYDSRYGREAAGGFLFDVHPDVR